MRELRGEGVGSKGGREERKKTFRGESPAFPQLLE